MVDSGAEASVIDSHYARNLNLVPFGHFNQMATNSLVNLQWVHLGIYQVGEVELYNQILFSYEHLSERFETLNVMGILGYDFLSRFVTKIDYQRQRISFYSPNKVFYSAKGVTVDTPLQNKILMVPMIIDAQYSGKFALDLGSYSLSINYPYAKAHQLFKKKGHLQISSDIQGLFYERKIVANRIQIADYHLNQEYYTIPLEKSVGTNSLSQFDGLLGNNILKHFLLYLDYEKQQVTFEPYQKNVSK
jgi:hypothetical protein